MTTDTVPAGVPAPGPAPARTLSVPGARLYVEVRGHGPTLLLVGNPMDADAFAPLAELLATDHTVVTTDPRGIHRSPVDDRSAPVSVETRADDLARLIGSVGDGPAAVVGSSGGAVSALALAQRHPEWVTTVVVHEAPLEELLDDREARRAATDAMVATYVSGDVAGAWALFLAEADIDVPDGADGPQLPPDPDPQAVADEAFFFTHLLTPTTRWVPDVDRLRRGGVRIVVGIGEESTGQVCDLTSRALATSLGIEPAIFPGDHTGFVAVPELFAARLRQALA
jgi:pimeloyl-ACP methyl ester carboxylesterase